MLPTDILIVYNRYVQIGKHVSQLIYSITCFLIVKTISWRRNSDFTIFVSPFDPFLSSKILSTISFGGRFKASLVPTCKMIYSGLCRKIGFLLSSMSLTLAPEKLLTLTLRFWIAGLVVDLRQLNHQRCKQYPVVMGSSLHYCQMLDYHLYQFH